MSTPMERQKAVVALRTRLALTQEQFAVVVGVSVRTVARWEHHNPPQTGKLKRLRELAEKHGCEAEALTFGP